jgi:hypothetical protein
MELDTRCVVCSRIDEDGGHLFFKCKYVKPVWQELGLEQVRTKLSEVDSPEGVVEEKERMRTVVLLWQWWWERNRVREGEKRRAIPTIAGCIAYMSDEFQTTGEKERHNLVRRKERWKKPGAGLLKINSDGAYTASTVTRATWSRLELGTVSIC